MTDRVRLVLSRDTRHDAPDVVEARLRNMVYGTSKT